MENTVNGLIVAAGLSARMGDFKPLMPFRGKTLIENTVDSMLLSGVAVITVVLGYRGEEVEAVLRSRYSSAAVQTVTNPDFAVTDMLYSVKTGLRALPPCSAFFLLPGDMPAVEKETFLALLKALPPKGSSVVFPTLEGYRKHPPLIGSAFIGDILGFEGEGGLREVWKKLQAHIITVPVDDQGCRADVDTPEQYARLLNQFDGPSRTLR